MYTNRNATPTWHCIYKACASQTISGQNIDRSLSYNKYKKICLCKANLYLQCLITTGNLTDLKSSNVGQAEESSSWRRNKCQDDQKEVRKAQK